MHDNAVELKFRNGKTLRLRWNTQTKALEGELYAGERVQTSLTMESPEDLEDVLNPLLLTALTAWRSLFRDRRRHACPVCSPERENR